MAAQGLECEPHGRRIVGRIGNGGFGRSLPRSDSVRHWRIDPDARLVYVGTGNAEPWTFLLRSSSREMDNLYVASILAVDVGTGELRWHYQVVPGDNWDFDSVQHLILADLTINGRPRKVIMQANKNAFYYVIDRLTGESHGESAGQRQCRQLAVGAGRRTSHEGRPVHGFQI